MTSLVRSHAITKCSSAAAVRDVEVAWDAGSMPPAVGPTTECAAFLWRRRADARRRISAEALRRLFISLEPELGSRHPTRQADKTEEFRNVVKAAFASLKVDLPNVGSMLNEAEGEQLLTAFAETLAVYRGLPQATSALIVSRAVRRGAMRSSQFDNTLVSNQHAKETSRTSHHTTELADFVTDDGASVDLEQPSTRRSRSRGTVSPVRDLSTYMPLGIEAAWQASSAFMRKHNAAAFVNMVSMAPHAAVCFGDDCRSVSDFWAGVRAAGRLTFPLSHPTVAEELGYELVRMNADVLMEEQDAAYASE